MKSMHRIAAVSVIAMATFLAPASAALAQEADQSGDNAADIIVTATKRSESVNKVAMSITAASGDDLAAAGIKSADDLGKIVPGFTFTQSAYSTPVYSLRGVGFYNYDIASTPTVTVYQDEAPLPFSAMSRGASFDLERVEVLKGPQGLLFGSNSTGGAVNYIAARPTKTLKAGMPGTVGSMHGSSADSFQGHSATMSGCALPCGTKARANGNTVRHGRATAMASAISRKCAARSTLRAASASPRRSA
jgi:iron complex outermembrane recepter protein